ncbi:retrovirus-related pol polyprotein from transposon TNT 1-94 [Tanacetum coccineum]
MENYKNVSEDIRNLLNAEAEAVHIILTWIDNDIYSTVDASPNAMKMWKAVKRSKQAVTRNRGRAIVNSPPPIYDQEHDMVTKDDALSKEKEIVEKIRIILQESTEELARECQKPKQAKDAAYHKEKILLCKQEEVRVQLSTEQVDWKDDTDDEPKDKELEAHYLYIAQIQEVTLDATDNSRPIFDVDLLQKQPESVNDTYVDEQGDTNITNDSVDMSTNGEEADQDDDDLARERDLLASLIEKLKCEIDESKNRNKCLESSNNHFKEANTKLAKNNQLMFKDLKKFQAELDRYHNVHQRTKHPIVVPISTIEPKRTVNQSVATPLKKTVALESTNQKPRSTIRKLYEHVSKTCSWWYPKITPPRYKWEPKSKSGNVNTNLVEIILFIVDSGCSKHMTRNLKLLSNFVEKILGTVKFRNDQITPILGYGDLVQGKVTIKRVYYVEVPNHNLFSVGQLYDADLEVAFWKSTCYIRDLKGNDLLTASSSQAWLWHRRLTHLNIDTINLLLKYDIVTGLPKLKFIKDYLCSSCELGKAKRKSFKTKTTPSSKRRLQILHMDLYGPMRVESINGKKYMLVIVDDYSRYTWTHLLRSKDETPEFLIDFLKLVQR